MGQSNCFFPVYEGGKENNEEEEKEEEEGEEEKRRRIRRRTKKSELECSLSQQCSTVYSWT